LERCANRLGELCLGVRACPGAAEAIASFQRRGIPTAIATSSYADSVQKKRRGYPSIFAGMTIVTGDDPKVLNGKPAPDIYLEAARRLGVPPEECLAFEDSLLGARAAKAAGCALVVIPDERIEKDDFRGVADEVLDSFQSFDLERWLMPLQK